MFEENYFKLKAFDNIKVLKNELALLPTNKFRGIS